jgi:hypothetical protein
MSNLQEALEASGLVVEAGRLRVAEQQVQEQARKERNANLTPQQRWWQNFRMSVTPLEIPIFVKVQCDKWTEGLDFIRARNLNKVTTRTKTTEEAIEQVRAKIVAWQGETMLVPGEEPPAGSLLYWRLYV